MCVAGEKTDKWLGVSEMILGVSIFGCVFALFSGQPVNIVGATGPLLVFEEGLYSVSIHSTLYYLNTVLYSAGLYLSSIDNNRDTGHNTRYQPVTDQQD